jgi:hypothetical protein
MVDTPDEALNALAPAASAALDGVWYPPVLVHGAMMWNLRFPGWRTIYGATAFGWHDRVQAEGDYYFASQNKEADKVSFKADPATLLTEAAPDSRFYGKGHLKNDQKFYDMQTQFFEQMVHQWRATADPVFEAKLRPALELHLEWLRDCFDPDGDGAYESYINTWPTDSVWFNGGGTPEETGYAYSGHQAARDLAKRAGDLAAVKRHEERLSKIREGFFKVLWNSGRGHPGLYREQGGHKRLHDDAWLNGVFVPIDSGLLSKTQALSTLHYTEWALQNDRMPAGGRRVWSSNFVPAFWSVRENWPGDNYHLALAYYQAGLGEEAWDVFKGNFLHCAYNLPVPGNLGSPQGGTDFGDCIHPFARTLVEGLFGYAPDYPNGIVRLRPQFPAEWDHASIQAPDFAFKFARSTTKTSLRVHLTRPARLDFQIPVYCERVKGVTLDGVPVEWKLSPGMGCSLLNFSLPPRAQGEIVIATVGGIVPARALQLKAVTHEPFRLTLDGWQIKSFTDEQGVLTDARIASGVLTAQLARRTGHASLLVETERGGMPRYQVVHLEVSDPQADNLKSSQQLSAVPQGAHWTTVDLSASHNADLRGIYLQKYLSPRPETISTRIGTDGYSPWTFPHWKSTAPTISFDLASKLLDPKDPGHLLTPQGVPFAWSETERNVAFTSLWENYPSAITVPVGRKAEAIWFLVAGSTTVMQCRIANAVLHLNYEDGTEERLELIPPYNYWNLCPIKPNVGAAGQSSRTYYSSELDAFAAPKPWPEIVELGTNCKAMLLNRRLKPGVVLKSVRLETLSQEVVVGLMGMSLMNCSN